MGKTSKSSRKRSGRKKTRSATIRSVKKANAALIAVDEERDRQTAQKTMPSRGKMKALAKVSAIPEEWWDEPLPF